MIGNLRHFEAGSDPFGRKWTAKFRWLQNAISIRHADAVDVKFSLVCDDGASEEKVIALPHAALVSLARASNRDLTDPWCMRLAATHLKRMIETFENMDKPLVSLTPAQLAEAAIAGQPPPAAR